MAPPSVGWHEPRPFDAPAPSMPPPIAAIESTYDATAAETKKSFSAAELDHVPRYIAPEEETFGAASPPQQVRALADEWQPNELASFSGAEWVPPAVDNAEVAAYVAPKTVSNDPRSPRNLIIALAGVALVAGLGFGVSRALAPADSKIVLEPASVETTVKASTNVSTTPSTTGTRPATRPGPIGAATAAMEAESKAAADAVAVAAKQEAAAGEGSEPPAP